MGLTRASLGQARALVVLLAASWWSNAQAVAVVDLGSAGNYTILAKTGISATGTTTILGDIGISPAAATYITGFGLILDPSVQFSTSSLLNGKAYAADYTPPTPARMTTAVLDMQTAYTDAAGRAPDVTELGAGEIGGRTLAPGVYNWSTDLNISTDVTLAGSATDFWVMQVAQELILANGKQVILSGGALASNIVWQVAGQVTLGTTSVMNGTILGQTAIVLKTGATLNGRALAQSAVTLDASAVSAAGGPNPPVAGKTFAYPSPAKGDVINMVYNMRESGRAAIRVWNENGDLAVTQEEQKRVGPQMSKVSIRGFAAGVYLYRVAMAYDSGKSERTEIQKFAVQR